MALKWGICSVGEISRRVTYCMTHHLDPSEHQVVACAARDLSRAQGFSKEFNIPRTYDSYQSLALDKDVDIVYIGTLHSEHHRLCLLFLGEGKHVLCEKPCTMNLKELRQVLEKAKEKKLFFMEAIWTRFLPIYKQFTHHLQTGAIGEPRLVNVVMSCNLTGIPNRESPELGGGGLLALGVYAIQLICLVFKEKPEKISATGHLWPKGVDDVLSLTLLYSGNRLGQLTMSISSYRFNSTSIIGNQGSLELPGLPWCPLKIVLPSGTEDFPLPTNNLSSNPTSLGYHYQSQAVAQCIKEGKLESPLMPHADSILIKEIMDEARRQLGVVFPQDTD